MKHNIWFSPSQSASTASPPNNTPSTLSSLWRDYRNTHLWTGPIFANRISGNYSISARWWYYYSRFWLECRLSFCLYLCRGRGCKWQAERKVRFSVWLPLGFPFSKQNFDCGLGWASERARGDGACRTVRYRMVLTSLRRTKMKRRGKEQKNLLWSNGLILFCVSNISVSVMICSIYTPIYLSIRLHGGSTPFYAHPLKALQKIWWYSGKKDFHLES